MKKKRRRYELKPEIERYHPNYLVGLTPEQVEERKNKVRLMLVPREFQNGSRYHSQMFLPFSMRCMPQSLSCC